MRGVQLNWRAVVAADAASAAAVKGKGEYRETERRADIFSAPPFPFSRLECDRERVPRRAKMKIRLRK